MSTTRQALIQIIDEILASKGEAGTAGGLAQNAIFTGPWYASLRGASAPTKYVLPEEEDPRLPKVLMDPDKRCKTFASRHVYAAAAYTATHTYALLVLQGQDAALYKHMPREEVCDLLKGLSDCQVAAHALWHVLDLAFEEVASPAPNPEPLGTLSPVTRIPPIPTMRSPPSPTTDAPFSRAARSAPFTGNGPVLAPRSPTAHPPLSRAARPPPVAEIGPVLAPPKLLAPPRTLSACVKGSTVLPQKPRTPCGSHRRVRRPSGRANDRI